MVIYFHYSILGPYSKWWPEYQKNAFAAALEGFNVVGIFHGHYHGSGHYKWKGFDVYNIGSPRHGMHSFAIVRITDTAMTVVSRRWEIPVAQSHTKLLTWTWVPSGWAWHHQKKINQNETRGEPRR